MLGLHIGPEGSQTLQSCHQKVTHCITRGICHQDSRPMYLHRYYRIDSQEALLPQTDRATRYVSRNLVNCCTTVKTSPIINPQQIEVMELVNRPTCNRLYASSHDASTVVSCDLQVRPSTSFVDNIIGLPWRRNFQVQSLGQSSIGKYLIFVDTGISL